MSILVIISSKVILFYSIQTKILLINLLLKYSNQTQILLLKDLFLKDIILKDLFSKDILPKVTPNGPKVIFVLPKQPTSM